MLRNGALKLTPIDRESALERKSDKYVYALTFIKKRRSKRYIVCSDVVREAGVEPARPCEHWHLKPASLPIPPLARMGKLSVCFAQCRHYITISESGCQVLF